jgi:hypothetical protein
MMRGERTGRVRGTARVARASACVDVVWMECSSSTHIRVLEGPAEERASKIRGSTGAGAEDVAGGYIKKWVWSSSSEMSSSSSSTAREGRYAGRPTSSSSSSSSSPGVETRKVGESSPSSATVALRLGTPNVPTLLVDGGRSCVRSLRTLAVYAVAVAANELDTWRGASEPASGGRARVAWKDHVDSANDDRSSA